MVGELSKEDPIENERWYRSIVNGELWVLGDRQFRLTLSW